MTPSIKQAIATVRDSSYDDFPTVIFIEASRLLADTIERLLAPSGEVEEAIKTLEKLSRIDPHEGKYEDFHVDSIFENSNVLIAALRATLAQLEEVKAREARILSTLESGKEAIWQCMTDSKNLRQSDQEFWKCQEKIVLDAIAAFPLPPAPKGEEG